MDGGSHGGSELTGGSCLASAMFSQSLKVDPKKLLDRKPSSCGMKKGKIKLTVIGDSEELLPLFKNSTLVVVKEGTQMSITDKDGNNELQISVPSERRSLQLKFLDEVSPTVLTGGGFNGKDDAAIRLAIVDKTTDKKVDAGPEASAKVEILILQANHDENEHNWTIEDFNRRIIIGSDKRKPYISKNVYVYLKGGEGSLCNIKLGHGCTWLKDCLCRLGARVVDNFSMSTVKEAWTNAFMVRDKRIKFNQKKKTPFLSDKICTLHTIQKGGKPEQRLQQEQIHTVEDLLIRLLKDPDGLKRIYLDSCRLGEKRWDDMVKNARSCLGGQRMYFYRNSRRNMGVIFNIHGEALRLYSDNKYAAVQMFSEKDKVDASELLSYAKGHWGDVKHFDDMSSFEQHLSSLETSVYQSDILEPGYAITRQSAHSGSLLQDIVLNKESTQDFGLEYLDSDVYQSDILEPGYAITRESAHSGSFLQDIVLNKESTQDFGLEYLDSDVYQSDILEPGYAITRQSAHSSSLLQDIVLNKESTQDFGLEYLDSDVYQSDILEPGNAITRQSVHSGSSLQDIVLNTESTQDFGLEYFDSDMHLESGTMFSSNYIFENSVASRLHILENSVDVMNVEAGTDRLAAGQAIGSHNTVNHAGSSLQGFVPIRASTQDIGLLEDHGADVPIMWGMSFEGNRSPQRLKMLCVVVRAAIRFQIRRGATFLKRATSNEGGARKRQKFC